MASGLRFEVGLSVISTRKVPIADLHTLLEEDLKAVGEPLSFRAQSNFCLFVNALLGEDATVQLVQHAL
jgi:hypothetical protein